MKKAVAIVLSISVLFCVGSFSAFADSGVLVMDNDALTSSGTINIQSTNGEEFGGYSMYSYLKASYYYNGDARRGSSDGYNATLGAYGSCYVWAHALPATTTITQLEVYLKEATFNDPAASYDGWTGYVGNIHYGVINQDTAPSGWSYVGSQNISGYEGYVPVYVFSSLTKNKYLGADAVRVTYYY